MKQFLFFFTILFSLNLVTVYAESTSTQTKQLSNLDNESKLNQSPAPAGSEIRRPNSIIVSATKLNTPYKEIGSAVTVIDAEHIKNTKKTNVINLLEEVPGLTVSRNGVHGQVSSVFIRGAESDHTMMLIDGVKVNDPVNPARSFDFGQLETTNVEKIEVLRGPQSTLYGSDAIGGVIRMQTKRGKGKPKFYFKSEAGSFNTFRQEGGVSGGTDLYNYSFGMSYTNSQGYYCATHTKGNREKDGFTNTTVSTRLGITPFENLDISTVIRYTSSKIEIDDSGGRGGDDPNHNNYVDHFMIRPEAKLTLFDGFYEQIFGVSVSEYDRDDKDKPDPADPYIIKSYYDSFMYQVDSQHNFYFPEFEIFNVKVNNILTAGIEHEQERGKSKYHSTSAWGPYTSIRPSHTLNTWSFYIQDKIALNDMFYTTIGGRWDDHSKAGTSGTIRVVPTIFIKQTGTKLKFSYGTGFKAPTISQLYGFGANENLDPEKSESWEVGIEQYLFNNRFHCGLTYFQNNFKDLIWTKEVVKWTTYENFNTERTESNGLELFTHIDILDNLYFGFDYTYIETKVLEATKDYSSRSVLDRTKMIRRPQNKVGIHLNYKFCQNKGNLYCELKYVGKRDDFSNFNTYERVHLKGYTLFNITGRFDITDNIEVYGKLHNIFDNYYEEVLGYDSQRFSLYGGIKITL
ncbi:TonB-dependent receptor [bacterium]|nr:TonB-dependent receptor [bacterium]